MSSELKRLAEICDRLELDDQAELCRRWLPMERTDRRVLYLTDEFPAAEPDNRNQRLWRRHFITARKRFAESLFEKARLLVQHDEESRAFALLWQVLREDPEHEQARQILGTLASAVSVRPRLRAAAMTHPRLGWLGNSYRRVQTPHFALVTRADAGASIRLAEQLETFYVLWSQEFFPLWAPPGLLQRRFDDPGGAPQWPQTRQMEVVLLADRQDYLDTLGVAESNIDVSVGYYAPEAEVSFFYPDPAMDDTLHHELTHQLLMEATAIAPQTAAGQQSGIWILEGVALYMESLQQRTGYWTLGGIESPRLQTARYRAVRDGYWPEWNDFTSAGLEQWKADSEIAIKYSHAAGLSHLFLELGERLPASGDGPDDTESPRDTYLAALTSVYQLQADFSRLAELLATADERSFEVNYQRALIIDDSQLEALLQDIARGDGRCRSLVLAGSRLEAESWPKLARLSQLTWLDLSFTNACYQDLQWLDQLQQLERLSLEGTSASGAILERVAELEQLSELDLTGCAVDDDQLQALQDHPGLETLWLGQTQVTDRSLEVLATMPELKYCNVAGSSISDAAWREFVSQQPRLAQP